MIAVTTPRVLAPVFPRGLDPGAICAWLLPVAVIAYLGVSNGGFGVLERSEVGIVLAECLLIGSAILALPVAGGTRAGRVSIAILLAFAAWTALSLLWTESPERTFTESARVGMYAAGFALALSAGSYWRQILAGTATAIGLLCAIALLSRFEPGLFPEQATGEFFSQQVVARLAYPLNYSSALGALTAVGLPLLLGMTSVARTIVGQAVAAAAIPACALTLWLTASGLAPPAVVLGLAAYLLLAPDRLPKLASMLTAAVGSAVLFAAVVQREDLDQGFTGVIAEQQGAEMLTITLVVCAAVGLMQVAIGLAVRHGERPRRLRISRRVAVPLVGAIAAATVIVAVAAGAAGEASDAWERFKTTPAETPTHESRAGQILEYSSNGRYDFWRSAVDAGASEPLTGLGAGTFEFWWTQEGDFGFIRDAHSLYFETFAELGIVGLLLIVAFTIAVLGIGARRALRASSPALRTGLAAATAGSLAFFATALTDWMWELAVMPAILFALAAVAISGGAERPPAVRRASSPRPWGRVAVAALALTVLVVNLVALRVSSKVEESRALASTGQLEPALEEAQEASSFGRFATSAVLQQALVLEDDGEIAAAAELARRAAADEPGDWRNWVVVARLEARLGNSEAAVEAYREAESLNPRSVLFS